MHDPLGYVYAILPAYDQLFASRVRRTDGRRYGESIFVGGRRNGALARRHHARSYRAWSTVPAEAFVVDGRRGADIGGHVVHDVRVQCDGCAICHLEQFGRTDYLRTEIRTARQLFVDAQHRHADHRTIGQADVVQKCFVVDRRPDNGDKGYARTMKIDNIFRVLFVSARNAVSNDCITHGRVMCSLHCFRFFFLASKCFVLNF